VLNCLHGETDSTKFIRKLNDSVGEAFGHAGRRIVKILDGDTNEPFFDFWNFRNAFLERAKQQDLPNVERRVAEYFATVAGAGSLAAEHEIVPWSVDQVMDAVLAVFSSWRSARLSQGSIAGHGPALAIGPDPITASTIESFLADIRALAPQYLPEADTLRAGHVSAHVVQGWIDRDKEPGVFVKNAYVIGLLDRAAVRKSVVDWLVRQKLIIPDRRGDVAVPKREPGGKPVRVYRFCLSVLQRADDLEASAAVDATATVAQMGDPIEVTAL
jgi:hypothetical protein